MRHGESQNNVLGKISKEAYNEKRVSEPEISLEGIQECEQLGEWLRTNKIQIDQMYTSAHKRAIMSVQAVRKAYQKEVPVELLLQIHERGGIYQGSEVFKGLTRS